MKSKHLLLTLLLALLVPWAASAQTSLFSEDFEDGSMPTGWTTDGSGSWTVGTGVNNSYPSTAGAGSYNARITHGTTGNATKLITPEINLSTVTSAELSFMHVHMDWSGDTDGLKVYYRTSSSETWIQLAEFTESGAYESWTTEEIVLPKSNGTYSSTYQIAFEYIDEWGRGLGIDAVSINQSAATPKPSGLAVSNISHNQANLSWNENGTATSWQICVNNDETNLITTTEKPYTLSNLTPLTTYTVKVRSVGTPNSDWTSNVSFSTTAVAEAVGDSWSDDFEGASCDWDLINGTLTNQWAWGTAANNGGTHALYISNDGGTSNAYSNGSAAMVYATKLLNFTEGKYEFSYDWKANGESTYDYLRVALVPASVTLTAGTSAPSGFSTTGLPSGWIALDGGSKLNQVTAWQSKSLAINVTAGNYYLVMAWKDDTSGGTNPPAAVDNVSITRMACPYDVTDLAVSNITTTGATLIWTAGEAEQWQVVYSTNSTFEGATEEIVRAATYTMTGLTGATNYYVKVRAYCGGTDFGAWSEVINFPTECEAMDLSTMDFSENFDDYEVASAYTAPSARVLPTCWKAINTTTYSTYKVFPTIYYYSSTNYANSTPNSLKFYSIYSSYSSYDPQPQYAILPVMEGLAGKQVTLMARGYNTTSTFKIGTMSDPTDASTFTMIAEQTLTTSYPAEPFEYTIPADCRDSYVAIMIDAANSSRTTNGVYIDDITIVEAPSCIKPSDLAVSNETSHGATFAWTAGAPTQTAWHLYFSKTNVAPADDIDLNEVTAVTTNPYTLATGLDAETNYFVWVRANCGTDDYSAWVGPVTFTTDVACPAPTNLAVTDGSITANEATVTWEGTSNSYVVMIGQEEIQTVTTDFEDQRIPTSFTNDASRPWTVTAGGANESGYCAIPGNAGVNSSSSDLTIQVTGPGTVSFNAKVSSEGNYDFGRFLIDGTQKMQISGTQDWTAYSYELTEGTHTLIWRYYKDSSTASGDDLFYVDDIVCPISTVPSWTEYTTDAQTYTFENLTPNTPYKVKVKGNCGDEGYSQETAPVSFTTLPSCFAPTGLAMVEGYPTAHEVSFTWDYEDGEVFQFALVPGNVTDPSEVNFNTTWYAGDNFQMWNTLSADTDWSFFLRKKCGATDFSDAVYVNFHTLEACPAPTGFAVMPNSITGHTADLTWQGSSNVYYVTYGAMNTTGTVLSTGFEDNTIPATMTNSTTYPWTVTAGGANESGYCAIPGNAGVNSSSSDLTFVVTGPGTVSFMARVSSESGYDYGRFLIDGSQKVNISGTQDWTAYEFELTAGTHTLIWRYYKDSSTASGNDLFYVDDINVTGLTVGEWQTVEATEVPFTLENLLPETPYQVTMYGDCGDDGYSQATAPVSFTTEIACHVPTNLTVIESTITTESAELTWEPGTDSPSQDTWQIAISDEEGFDPDELIDLINVRESPTYVLNNLTQNTTYYIYVRALCGTEDYSEWSAMSSFTTLPSCQAPEDLRVDYLSQTSATVRWSGNADNYILTLGQAALGVTFEDNNILALFNNNSSYPWTIEEMNGSYCMRSGNAGEHNSASSISISVYYDVDGTLEFDAECRGEGTSTYWDHCDFYIDDERQLYVGANVSGWNHYSYEIPAGEHTFTWSYTKDGSTHPTGDYFAVDNIMSNIVWRTPSTGSSTEYFYYNLDEGTYYVVKAQGICGNDLSPVSEISFTTPLYTYTKSITGYGENTTGGYYLIASPITKVTPTANNGFLTNEYDLYSFDQTFYALEWRNFKSDAFDLVSGQGYLYANSQDVNLTFTGRIYRGNGEISLTRDENTAHPDMQGFNLVGNPYNTRATVNKDFYKMNDTRDGFIAVNHDNAIIEVMDGIFVYAAEDGETITFHEYVPSYAPQPSAGLTMNVTGNQRGNTIDRAIVRFGQSSMMPKFQLNENSTKVYIPMDGKDYAVVSTGNVGELPVNFKAESNGTYTLSFTAQEVSFSYLHLIDNLTGADVNLLKTPSYTFDARTTDYASRFRLVFSTGSSAEGDNFSFVNAAGNLCIFGIEGEATLQVVDVLGHVISSNQFSGSYEQKLNVAPGVYMLRLINGNDVKVQKMVIK